jgi:hypothetical protein
LAFENVPTAQASSGPDADTLAKALLVANVAVACGLTVVSTCQIEAVVAAAGVVRPVEVIAPVVMAAAISVTSNTRSGCMSFSMKSEQVRIDCLIWLRADAADVGSQPRVAAQMPGMFI